MNLQSNVSKLTILPYYVLTFACTREKAATRQWYNLSRNPSLASAWLTLHIASVSPMKTAKGARKWDLTHGGLWTGVPHLIAGCNSRDGHLCHVARMLITEVLSRGERGGFCRE